MQNTLRFYAYFIACFFYCSTIYADIASYNSASVVLAESNKLSIFHYHDYTNRRHNELNNILKYGSNAIFNEQYNTYSYLIAINKITKDTLFKKPCPPLTKIIVSEDEKYIVGLSDIKLRNPYELVIFDTLGHLIYKRDIGALKFRFFDNELKQLIDQFPNSFNTLINDDRIEFEDGFWQVAPNYMEIQDTAFKSFLLSFPMTSDNIFVNQTESVTNFKYWFDEKEPSVKIIEKNGKIDEVIIRDNTHTLRTIKVNHRSFNRDYFISLGFINDKFPIYVPIIETSPQIKEPYLQLGNINEYVTTIDTFLNQGEMRFMNYDKISDSCKIISYEMTILYEDTLTISYKIQGATITNNIKNQIRILKKIRKVYIENIKVYCKMGSVSGERIFMPIIYNIIESVK